MQGQFAKRARLRVGPPSKAVLRYAVEHAPSRRRTTTRATHGRPRRTAAVPIDTRHSAIAKRSRVVIRNGPLPGRNESMSDSRRRRTWQREQFGSLIGRQRLAHGHQHQGAAHVALGAQELDLVTQPHHHCNVDF
jgi:hypothetical protein